MLVEVEFAGSARVKEIVVPALSLAAQLPKNRDRSMLHPCTLLVSIAATALTISAHASVYHYALTFANGFVADGEFATMPTAPSSFIEKNPLLTGETTGSWDSSTFQEAPYATSFVQSQNMRMHQNGALLEEGTSVVAGVCLDKFFYLNFSDIGGPAIAAIDFSTARPGATSYYFISNGVNSSGVNVAYGTTGYNLFSFDVATLQAVYLGTATSLTVNAVPAPGVLAMLAVSMGFGAGARRRRTA
jgi:hypothetical protein